MVSISTRETRWEAFRREHRRSPIKKTLQAVLLLIIISLYGYAFFFCQSDRSYETVSTWNEVLKMKAKEEYVQRAQERASSRLRGGYFDHQVGRIDADGTILLYQNNDKQRHSLSSRRTLRQQQQQQQQQQEDESDGFFRIFFLFFMLRIYLRMCAERSLRPTRNVETSAVTSRNRGPSPEIRLHRWGQDLNRDRRALGLPRLSLARLHEAVGDREPNENDYIELLQYDPSRDDSVDDTSTSSILEDSPSSPGRPAQMPLRSITDPTDELLLNSATCSLCTAEFQVGDEVRMAPCLHLFHRRCIDSFLRSNAHCPACMYPIS